MNGFQCNMDGATNDQPLPQGNPARRFVSHLCYDLSHNLLTCIRSCGDDKFLNRPADPSNCTIGAKQPNYWHQLENINVHWPAIKIKSHSLTYFASNSRIFCNRRVTKPCMASRMARRPTCTMALARRSRLARRAPLPNARTSLMTSVQSSLTHYVRPGCQQNCPPRAYGAIGVHTAMVHKERRA